MDNGPNGLRELERALKSLKESDPSKFLSALFRSGTTLQEKLNEELVSTQLYFKNLLLGYAKFKLPLGYGESWFGIPYKEGEAPEGFARDLMRSRGWDGIGTVELKKDLTIFSNGYRSTFGHPKFNNNLTLKLIPDGSIADLPAGLYSFELETFNGHYPDGRHRHFESPNITTAHECLENYIRYRNEVISVIDQTHEQQRRYLLDHPEALNAQNS